MRILIINDSPEERLLLHEILTEGGYADVRSALSAQHAFEQLGLQSSAQAEAMAVDLILLDVAMHNSDALEICRQIKAAERYYDVPILITTARERTTKFLEAAFNAGAVDYVTKPLDRVELLARMSLAFKLKQELDCRRSWGKELSRRLEALQHTLDEVKSLHGVIPICSYCKKVQQDPASWQPLDEYVEARSEATFSYDICSACMKQMYPSIDV